LRLSLKNALRRDAHIIILLERGANPHTWDWWGRTALYVAVDIAPSWNTTVVADAVCLPFADSSADLVASFEVVQHIQSPDLMISEAVRVLKPGAYLLMTFPFLYAECDFHDYHRWTMEELLAAIGP